MLPGSYVGVEAILNNFTVETAILIWDLVNVTCNLKRDLLAVGGSS